jgi:hypothetical protein
LEALLPAFYHPLVDSSLARICRLHIAAYVVHQPVHIAPPFACAMGVDWDRCGDCQGSYPDSGPHYPTRYILNGKDTRLCPGCWSHSQYDYTPDVESFAPFHRWLLLVRGRNTTNGVERAILLDDPRDIIRLSKESALRDTAFAFKSIDPSLEHVSALELSLKYRTGLTEFEDVRKVEMAVVRYLHEWVERGTVSFDKSYVSIGCATDEERIAASYTDFGPKETSLWQMAHYAIEFEIAVVRFFHQQPTSSSPIIAVLHIVIAYLGPQYAFGSVSRISLTPDQDPADIHPVRVAQKALAKYAFGWNDAVRMHRQQQVARLLPSISNVNQSSSASSSSSSAAASANQ